MIYIGVSSVDEYLLQVEKLGGKVLMLKTVVPGWGYLAICMDTENNTFGLWEDDEKLRNDETIISSISVTDIVFDVYLGKWNYRATPKIKTWSYFLTIPK